MTKKNKISGLILAGGLSKRMNGEFKALIQLDNIPLIAQVTSRLNPQVDELLISANQDHQQLLQYSNKVFSDSMEGHLGPLAGILTAFEKMQYDHLLVVPCDSPLLPLNLAAKLLMACIKQDAKVSVAHDGEHLQPIFCLLHHSLKDSLQQYLSSGERRLGKWLQQNHAISVDFSEQKRAFYNINQPQDLDALLFNKSC